LTQLDSYATTKLQEWLRARAYPVGPESKLLLEQLHEFAWQVHSEGLDSILRKRINIAPEGTTTIALFESIADLLCRGIGTNDRAMAMKSLQETFFVCTEVEPDLSPSQLGKRLESYLELRGSKGLIRTFLSVHLSNLIFMDLHGSLQAPAQELFRSRIEGIERLCQTVAGLSVRSWSKWPKHPGSLISSAVQIASVEMRKGINPKARAARSRS
jgi:hypothetical protein